MYTNAKYMKNYPSDASASWISVYINGVQSAVPIDPANTDYQNIMALVEKGELTIAPAEEQK
jgi:hypothetical protein